MKKGRKDESGERKADGWEAAKDAMKRAREKSNLEKEKEGEGDSRDWQRMKTST